MFWPVLLEKEGIVPEKAGLGLLPILGL